VNPAKKTEKIELPIRGWTLVGPSLESCIRWRSRFSAGRDNFRGYAAD